jgi:hypothetical protein
MFVWDPYNLTSTLDSFSFLDQSIRTEKHNTNLASFQVHAHALDTGGEFDQLFGLDIAHAMHTGNTVTNGQNTACLSKTRLFLDTSDSLLEDGRNFGGRCFGIGGVCPDLLGGGIEGCWCSGPGLSKILVSTTHSNATLIRLQSATKSLLSALRSF